MSKISELSDGGSLTSTDYLIAVRSGGNVKVRMDQINVDQVDLGDNEFIRLGNSQDLTMVHTSTQSIINQAGIGDLLIQKAGATKLTINASGIDVTGSVTADGLTVENTAGATLNINTALQAADSKILLHEGTTASPSNGASIRYDGAANLFKIGVGASVDTTRLSIDRNTGDISFYEDTGTTPKFFWDASAERLGIGTVTPGANLEVSGSGTGASAPTVRITNSLNSGDWSGITDAMGRIEFYSTDSSGNAPYTTGFIESRNDYITGAPTLPSGALVFGTTTYNAVSGATERMRIDSLGNAMFNTTNADPAGNNVFGTALLQYGGASMSRVNTAALSLNRASSDGAIITLRRDGTTVGFLMSRAGLLTTIILDPRSGQGAGLTGAGAGGDTLRHITPTNESGAEVNGKVSLGNASNAFKNLYLSGGVVFGTTGGAVSSKTLEDYEEGTWTPTVTSSGGTITTVTSQIGTYTKIGRLVTLQYQFNIATLGTASGNIIVSGMPFTEDNTEISYYAGIHRARSGGSSITEFDPGGTLQLYGTTPVAGVYYGSMVYNTTS
jgi:hypothetical protein